MGMFRYTCPEHGLFAIMQARGGKTVACPKCGVDAKRKIEVGSVHTTDVIDNGLMVRALERATNIEEQVEESIDNHEKAIADD